MRLFGDARAALGRQRAAYGEHRGADYTLPSGHGLALVTEDRAVTAGIVASTWTVRDNIAPGRLCPRRCAAR